MLKKYVNVNFFFANILIPLIVLAFYCGSFSLLSSHFLPKGVNYYFSNRFFHYLLLLILGICLLFGLLSTLIKNKNHHFKKLIIKFSLYDFLFLLLPLTPIVQYILNNQDILSLAESLSILILFIILSSLYVIAIPQLLKKISSTRILMPLGLAFVFTIVSMASISQYFFWYEQGSLKWQLLIFSAVFLITWLLYCPKTKTILYLFIVINFVVNSSFQLLSSYDGKNSASLPIKKNALLSFAEKRKPVTTPNIYLLVYDAYVTNETMLSYGIDNSTQENYLKKQGFELYPHTYSIASSTIETMSRVLNASTEFYGVIRRGVSGDGIVQNILKSFGYETYGIFPSGYVFGGIGSAYDFSFPKTKLNIQEQSILFLRAILIGEFRFELEFTKQSRKQFLKLRKTY